MIKLSFRLLKNQQQGQQAHYDTYRRMLGWAARHQLKSRAGSGTIVWRYRQRVKQNELLHDHWPTFGWEYQQFYYDHTSHWEHLPTAQRVISTHPYNITQRLYLAVRDRR